MRVAISLHKRSLEEVIFYARACQIHSTPNVTLMSTNIQIRQLINEGATFFDEDP